MVRKTKWQRAGARCRLNHLAEEQRQDAETFGERHTDDGLNEDLAGSGGIATDGFGGFEADETDADGGAEEAEGTREITGDAGGSGGLGDDVDHGMEVSIGCCCSAVRARGTLPAGK